jgi:hypothetical protein
MTRFVLAPLVLILAAVTAQGKLELRDVQAAYGPVWPQRTSLDYYPPQDVIFFRFLITGAKLKDGGELDTDVEVKLIDGKGRVVLSQVTPYRGGTQFGGDPFLGYAFLLVTGTVQPGEYTFSATLTDNVSLETAGFERKVRITPPELAVQAVQLFHDPAGRIHAPAQATVGGRLYVRLNIVGFGSSEGKVDLTHKWEVVDAETKAVMPQPIEAAVRDAIPPGGGVFFNGDTGAFTRPGKFLMRSTITDRISSKTIQYELPLTVSAP